jgi:hypothetical protein
MKSFISCSLLFFVFGLTVHAESYVWKSGWEVGVGPVYPNQFRYASIVCPEEVDSTQEVTPSHYKLIIKSNNPAFDDFFSIQLENVATNGEWSTCERSGSPFYQECAKVKSSEEGMSLSFGHLNNISNKFKSLKVRAVKFEKEKVLFSFWADPKVLNHNEAVATCIYRLK